MASRDINVDGTYWKPEQYPKTTWVAATGPPVDPSTLSGYTCANPIIIDKSFDSNYKLFKNQNGEVFARFTRTNCRNGSPMKKIWVPKSLLERLPVNVIMTPPGKKTNPRPKASYGPKSSYRRRSSYDRANTYVLQGYNDQTHEYESRSSKHYVHKSKNFSAYSFEYSNPHVKLFARASKPKFSDAALRLIASKPPFRCGWLRRTDLSCRVRSPAEKHWVLKTMLGT